MTRLRGWAPKGERLVDKVPHGRWKTATFLAALRNDRIEAPCLFDGPINGERFRAYVEQFLTPTLKPGDVVILDNLGSGPAFRHGRDVWTVPACRGRGVNVRCRCRNRSSHRSCYMHRTGEVGWADRTANTGLLGVKENVVVLRDMPTLRLLQEAYK